MLSRRFLRIKALKALYSHYTVGNEPIVETRNKMLLSINKTYELYYLMLSLVDEVATYADNVIEINKNKHLATEEDKNPNLKFVENSIIALLRQNELIKTFMDDNSVSWGSNNELFKQIYNSMTSKEYYKKYMNSQERSLEQDRALVLDFYRNEIEDNEFLMTIIEDMSIYWTDEVEFIATKAISTFTKWTADKQPILTLYVNADDEQYVKDLLIYTISNYDKAIDLIGKYSKNWDLDRVTLMDKLIIAMAYTELVDFPSIPVKASLDEYIELSKFYSTVSSNIYINGLLDKILTELRRDDKIKKAGRGLQAETEN